MLSLYEQHRPRDWAGIVGQDKAVRQIQVAGKRGWGGRAWWLTGASGTGKTTIAHILAHELAEPFNVQELDAGRLTPARLADIEGESQLYGMGAKSGRVYICNESHGLARATVRQLLVTLERIPSHVAWIFTTTFDGQDSFDGIDADPLLSRCLRVNLSRRGLCEPFAVFAQNAARKAGLDGQPIERYRRLLKDSGNNLRTALTAIEAGAMAGGE